jgi:cell division protein FtsI/penicillin-binding protein 2
MLRQLKVQRYWITVLCIVTAAILLSSRALRDRNAAAAPPALIASVAQKFEPPLADQHWLVAREEPAQKFELPFEWSRVRRDGSGYVEVLPDGSRAELTIDPALQSRVERVLNVHPTSYGAAVVLSVEDGRVLAMTARSSVAPRKSLAELVLSAWAPAASVFKLVTATALLERGVQPDTRVCYHDGVHSVENSNLRSNSRLDRNCNSFSFGLAKSQNAVIARLAIDHLDPAALRRVAQALGFGAPLPFAAPVAASAARVPDGGLPFARTAAGFWNTTLSPLHGAWLAATLARGGVTPPLRLIERIVDGSGRAVRPAAAPERRVVTEAAARALGRMMVGTTEYGTARLGFHDPRTNRSLLPVAVAGKTGTLDRHKPYLSYSWFVGFAPAERPQVAVAVLLGNRAAARLRAHQVARELLSSYFDGDNKADGHVASQ